MGAIDPGGGGDGDGGMDVVGECTDGLGRSCPRRDHCEQIGG